jgi:hypothetical protein
MALMKKVMSRLSAKEKLSAAKQSSQRDEPRLDTEQSRKEFLIDEIHKMRSLRERIHHTRVA